MFSFSTWFETFKSQLLALGYSNQSIVLVNNAFLDVEQFVDQVDAAALLAVEPRTIDFFTRRAATYEFLATINVYLLVPHASDTLAFNQASALLFQLLHLPELNLISELSVAHAEFVIPGFEALALPLQISFQVSAGEFKTFPTKKVAIDVN